MRPLCIAGLTISGFSARKWPSNGCSRAESECSGSERRLSLVELSGGCLQSLLELVVSGLDKANRAVHAICLEPLTRPPILHIPCLWETPSFCQGLLGILPPFDFLNRALPLAIFTY